MKSPIFITIIVFLFLAVSVFNFTAQEKEAEYIRDEMHILASQRENTNKEIQTLFQKLNSALQDIKNIRTERVYIEEEINAVKRQINGIHSQLDNISETQYLNEKRFKALSIAKNKSNEPAFHPLEVSPQDGKELLKAEDSLESKTRATSSGTERQDQDTTEHFQKAVFHQKNGELSKALQEYENILKIDPLIAEVHNNMGLLYQEKGEYNKALLAYRKAVSLKPDYNKARNNMGTVLYKQGHLEAAGQEFKSILEKEPENVHALTNLAIIYKKNGEFEKAGDLLLKALVFEEEFPGVHYNLALILEERGRIDEAIIHYRAFLKYSHDAYTSLTTDVLKRLEVIEKK